MKEKITITLNSKVLKKVDSIVDRIYIRNRSQAVEYLIEKSFGKEKIAVILATGPAKSLEISKGMYRSTAKVGSTTVIEIAIKNLRSLGFKTIFIIGEQKVLTSIFSIVGDGKIYGVNISFIQNEKSPGTAESLRLLKGEIESTFLVVFGDIIFNRMETDRLWKHHLKHKGIATLMVTPSSLIMGGSKKPIHTSPLKIEGDMVIRAFPKLSKPLKSFSESSIVFSSLFVAEPEILSYTGDSLENEVFPAISQKGLLYSYLSSEGEIHIHSKEDTRFVRNITL